MSIDRREFWDSWYRPVSDYPLEDECYAIPLGKDFNTTLPTNLDDMSNWGDNIEKLAWDCAKIPAQLYMASNQPLVPDDKVDDAFPVLIISGPDYTSTKKTREKIAHALGVQPRDIKRVYLAVFP